ncbi:MAG: hypothetical protein NWE93_06745 [Candidatus Bathyarchaeota archaeon]|nr:hypothetical protein [Candidatus Bathyarchaeota archaeon]
MSFGGFKVFNGLQEVLVLALMMVSMLALFYAPIDLSYKIGIGIISFLVIMLMTIATQKLREQKELRERQIKEA